MVQYIACGRADTQEEQARPSAEEPLAGQAASGAKDASSGRRSPWRRIAPI
jgi:hypothetical protein